ncbi:hypothetical protein [Metasolibacillus meyeri]|uniref:hypothetical protein n=1 Tax=Metasolibacillus meyeri TaxID=1071052 RepID=UPI000D2F897E|nr:hypothetical protein [Metasolibacillus meyeri]
MKLGITREDIVNAVKLDIELLIKSPQKIKDVVNRLEKDHDIPRSDVLQLLNTEATLKNIDLMELGIIGETIALALGKGKDWLNKYFNPPEIERMSVYKRAEVDTSISLSFKPAIKLNDNVFIIGVSRQDIAKMYDKGLFTWDEKIQREGKRKTYNNVVFSIPKLNEASVREIKEQVLQNVLVENELAYNLVKDSADDGVELYYNEETFELTFASKFIGQIIDGMHRTAGIHMAWMEDNNISGYMPIRISNYTTKEATRYQYELSKMTPIDKSRLQVLSHERINDRIVNNLKVDGRLRNRISNVSIPDRKMGELVAYIVLSDAFYHLFEKQNNTKTGKLTEEFSEYLTYLFEYYEDDYLNDASSLLFKNKFFYWHVYIFKKMLENAVSFHLLHKIINVDYFNKHFVLESFGTKQINDHQIRGEKEKQGLWLMNKMLAASDLLKT